MINALYRLTAPLTIETFYENIDCFSGNLIVRPRMLSVCKADIRYYFGMRNADILKERLPMALLHEACGTVVYDGSGNFQVGDKVILLPNIPGKNLKYEENYRRDSLFRSSRADGFMQELVSIPRSQVVKYEKMDYEIAAFAESVSVAVHAVESYLKKTAGNRDGRRKIGVWGSGAMGYMVCCILKYRLPSAEITVIGRSKAKLDMFSFVNQVFPENELPKDMEFDDCFECVGGVSSGAAIRQMIAHIRPEGIMLLLGVSEEPVPVNTRMVLEKGLTLLGRSRSGRKDFLEAAEILDGDEVLRMRMKSLISDVVNVYGVNDIHRAFNESKTADYKVVLDWQV